MADATENRTNLVTKPGNGMAPRSYVVKDGVTIPTNCYVGVDADGFLDNWSDSSGMMWKGLSVGGNPSVNGSGSNESKVTGNTSADRPPEMLVDESGVTVCRQAVANESAQTAVGEEVAATDNQTLTNAAPVSVDFVADVVRYYSATEFDVRLKTPGEYASSL